MGTVGTVNLDEMNPAYSRNYNNQDNKIYLEEKLKEVKDKQGIFGNAWNGFKEFTHLGQSASDCDKMLDKYKSGEISFDEAVEYIDSFDNKQENMKGLISNILTGIGSIAGTIAMFSNPATITLGMALKGGAPVGAALKAGLNLLDRATNKVEGDEVDVKTIAKDVLEGAVTGATSAVSSGVGKGIKSANFGLAVRNGMKCGLLCGAASGSSSYIIDTAFDENKKFDFGDFAKNTATSALVSGGVGTVVGAGMYGTANVLTHTVGQNASKSTIQSIVDDSATSSLRKVFGRNVRDLGKAVTA